MGQDVGFAVSKTPGGWRQVKSRLRRHLDIERLEAQLLEALLCTSGDLRKKLGQGMFALCPYTGIRLLTVNDAQIEAESAGDGVFQADPELAVHDFALGRAT